MERPGDQSYQTGYLNAGLSGSNIRLFGMDVGLVETQAIQEGLYDLHVDPGVRFVVMGAWVLAVGTLWSLIGYLGQARRAIGKPDAERGGG